jgi:hypothetical protein
MTQPHPTPPPVPAGFSFPQKSLLADLTLEAVTNPLGQTGTGSWWKENDWFSRWKTQVNREGVGALLVPFSVPFPATSTPNDKGIQSVTLTPLACMLTTWSWPRLAAGLAHVVSLGLVFGAQPDVLAGMDWAHAGEQMARAAPFYDPHLRIWNEPRDFVTWNALRRWEGDYIPAKNRLTPSADIWAVLAARLPREYLRHEPAEARNAIVEGVGIFLDAGADPDGLSVFLERIMFYETTHPAHPGTPGGNGPYITLLTQQDEGMNMVADLLGRCPVLHPCLSAAGLRSHPATTSTPEFERLMSLLEHHNLTQILPEGQQSATARRL